MQNIHTYETCTHDCEQHVATAQCMPPRGLKVEHITSHTQIHMAKLHKRITSYFFFASCWWRYSLLMSWDSRDTGLSTCNHVSTHTAKLTTLMFYPSSTTIPVQQEEQHILEIIIYYKNSKDVHRDGTRGTATSKGCYT